MADEWFYRTSTGEEKGPVTAQKLKQLAVFGLIEQDTEVKKGREGRWIPASKVKGLLETTSSPAEPDVDRKPTPPPRTPPAPARAPSPRQREPSEAETTEAETATKKRPLVLIGAGVGGLLLLGIVAGFVLSNKSGEKNGEASPAVLPAQQKQTQVKDDQQRISDQELAAKKEEQDRRQAKESQDNVQGASKILEQAELALVEADTVAAAQLLRQYISSPQAIHATRAKAMLEQVELVTSDTKAATVLKEMLDSELALFTDKSPSPSSVERVIKSGYGDLASPALVSICRKTLIRNLPKEQARRHQESIKNILVKLEDKSKAADLFLSSEGRKGRDNLGKDVFEPYIAAALMRAIGHGKSENYQAVPIYKDDPRLRLQYLNKKEAKLLEVAEAYATGRWPPTYRGTEDRRKQMGRAFWLTELVVVKCQLPDFKFSTLSIDDQGEVLQVLKLFGDIILFEGLPYEVSGTDALKRLEK